MTLVAPAAVVESVTDGEVTASAAVIAYVFVWAERVSEEVVTATLSPVEVSVGLETPFAITCMVSPAATVHPPTVRVTVAPLLLVTQFSNPRNSSPW